jgi:hypothetical protein
MDLNQRKLNKSEWETIEVPVSQDEIEILNLIIKGFHDVNIKYNKYNSLFSFLKIDYGKPMEDYLFYKYFEPKVKELFKKYSIDFIPLSANSKPTIKKADLIRIEKNNTSSLEKNNIYEYILLEHIEKLFKYKNKNSDKWKFHYYTIYKLVKNSVVNLNRHIYDIIKLILTKFEEDVSVSHIIENAYNYIEKNENIIKYGDITLYDHQKEIFTITKNEVPKLVLYIAPTGTGKTLTPLGLSEKYKVIFVCAARHVGLALARAAISVNKKIAFAFGCASADDIRLHYFAAKDYTVNRKSGGIWKVDNSNGTKVEIIICDIKSYLPAMYYMKSFNPLESLLTYWDEPTITMDYENHEFHEIIKKNWSENIIYNMVLSSATLPKLHELPETISDFKIKFPQAEVFNIVSHDCKKSIPIINSNGYVVLPHYLSEDYDQIKLIVSHCEEYLTLLRYFDLSEVVNFIIYVEKMKYLPYRIQMERYFETIGDVDMTNIKLYYLNVLKNIHSGTWGAIYLYFYLNRKRRIAPNNSIDKNGNRISKISSIGPGIKLESENYSGESLKRLASEQYVPLNQNKNLVELDVSGNCAVYVTTKDAYTLTDGPTIFLSNDVEKIAKFCIQQSNIPEKVMEEITNKILFNNKINDKIEQLEKDIEDMNEQTRLKDDNPSGNLSKKKSFEDSHKFNRNTESNIDIKNKFVELNNLKAMIKVTTLNDIFIPNSIAHIKKWTDEVNITTPFRSDISEDIITKIMLLNNVENSWKVLLLMGIGVFTNHENITYTEIMKTLADQQKLYMIIASSDYIYGTNYQFCHGYLSKDLNLTQEKIMQSMGRLGRKNIQQNYTIRFRDDKQILKIFTKELDKPEVINMNKLFNSN